MAQGPNIASLIDARGSLQTMISVIQCGVAITYVTRPRPRVRDEVCLKYMSRTRFQVGYDNSNNRRIVTKAYETFRNPIVSTKIIDAIDGPNSEETIGTNSVSMTLAKNKTSPEKCPWLLYGDADDLLSYNISGKDYHDIEFTLTED